MKLFGKRNKKSKNGKQDIAPTKDIKPTGSVKPAASISQPRKKGTVKKVLSGDVLTSSNARRHYPFALYCCLLVLLYMGYVFSSHRLQRQKIEASLELQRIRAKALLYSSERIEASRHSTIVKEIEKREIKIKEWPTPPQLLNAHEGEDRKR